MLTVEVLPTALAESRAFLSDIDRQLADRKRQNEERADDTYFEWRRGAVRLKKQLEGLQRRLSAREVELGLAGPEPEMSDLGLVGQLARALAAIVGREIAEQEWNWDRFQELLDEALGRAAAGDSLLGPLARAAAAAEQLANAIEDLAESPASRNRPNSVD